MHCYDKKYLENARRKIYAKHGDVFYVYILLSITKLI